MTLWSDLLPQTTLASASATIKGLWASSGVPLTNVRRTAVQFQAAMAHVNAAYSFTQIVNKLVRGFGSLDTATDPGDNDPYDPNNVTLAQSPGLLSYLGQNTYGTTRTQATNAATTVTLMNSSASVATITADALTFTCGATGTTAYGATYRNSYSSSIYASAGNTTTILPGGTLTIPVTAEIAGSAPSAPANSLTLTSTVLGLSVLAQPAAIGLDVEPAADYRSRCRGAAAMLSMCGPGQAYSFIATAAQVDSSGNVYVFNEDNSAIIKIAAGGGSSSTFTTFEAGGFSYAMLFDASGNLWCYDENTGDLNYYNSAAVKTTYVSTGLGEIDCYGLAIDTAGAVYFTAQVTGLSGIIYKASGPTKIPCRLSTGFPAFGQTCIGKG